MIERVKVRLIVADPPWKFGDKLPGTSRGAEKNYPCMTVDELIAWRKTWAFDVADDCYLLCWRVASMQEEALAVIRGWGFTVKSELVWIKKTVTGKRWFGMGRTFRAEHEVCLAATRGSPKPLLRNVRSTFEGVVREHSQKPEEFFTLVESAFDAPRVELFARAVRPGWLQVGNELPPEVEQPIVQQVA